LGFEQANSEREERTATEDGDGRRESSEAG